MPKPKPDEVIRHEIVFGSTERQIAKDLRTALVVNKVITPFTSLLSSTTGLLLVTGLGLAYLEQFLPEDWQYRTDEQLRDWFETENLAAGGVGSILGGLIGAMFGGIPGAGLGAVFGGVTGSVTQEVAEEAQAGGVPAGFSYGSIGLLIGAARLLKNVADDLQNEN